ncbi:hypothetical protein GGR06_001632 [Bacteroides reticulotermitis]|uniref:Uncharacterized protein n=2 Tax=Bacteroides reticulotermitis TaxID=1133319 RepID=W4UQA4_9BACE|nr:hypothetical protein [Bacteroides reticulotermitis]MBB4043846.1 hypothetical protein [Bacteroides reticulotermitis]GAE83360.1 hypothetical protein JCM10512_1628 [Bacteroides reticulotermitis JCM 10512]
MNKRVTIHWAKTCTPEIKERICNRFGIPRYTTINGETPCEIRDEDLELLRQVEKKGFIELRNK